MNLLGLAMEINSCDGSFPEFDVYGLSELSELLSGKDAEEIMKMVYYGDFNPARPHHRFDGYGNIESVMGADLQIELDDCKDDILQVAEDLGIDVAEYE